MKLLSKSELERKILRKVARLVYGRSPGLLTKEELSWIAMDCSEVRDFIQEQQKAYALSAIGENEYEIYTKPLNHEQRQQLIGRNKLRDEQRKLVENDK